MSIVLRVIDHQKPKNHNYCIKEYLLGLIALHSFDAKSLANAIVDILNKYNIDLNFLWFYDFDSFFKNTSIKEISCSNLTNILLFQSKVIKQIIFHYPLQNIMCSMYYFMNKSRT